MCQTTSSDRSNFEMHVSGERVSLILRGWEWDSQVLKAYAWWNKINTELWVKSNPFHLFLPRKLLAYFLQRKTSFMPFKLTEAITTSPSIHMVIFLLWTSQNVSSHNKNNISILYNFQVDWIQAH